MVSELVYQPGGAPERAERLERAEREPAEVVAAVEAVDGQAVAVAVVVVLGSRKDRGTGRGSNVATFCSTREKRRGNF